MGKIKKGILGGFRGTVGTVIGAKWKSIDYMRSRPTSVRNPRTQPQTTQRTKFKAALDFVRLLGEFVNIAYGKATAKMTAHNAAMRDILSNFILPDNTVDIEIYKPSTATLPNETENTAFTSQSSNDRTFSWNLPGKYDDYDISGVYINVEGNHRQFLQYAKASAKTLTVNLASSGGRLLVLYTSPDLKEVGILYEDNI